jgi:CDP-6-deoxy-D-xylo-4-hexulose-3-dehydrase
VHAGYVPVFADCDADTYQIDLESIERCIGPKTRALLVPNLIGGIPDWDRLRQIADRHHWVLVEDSCDTLGASFRGAPPGTRADLSLTSFSLYHIITALGNGGMVCTDDARIWDRALTLRGWGRSSEPFLFGTRQAENDGRFEETLDGLEYDGLFIFRELGYGFVPSEAGAAFGLAQLDKLEALSARRAALFESHQAFFREHQDVFIAPRVLDGVVTTWICYPVLLRETAGLSRKALQLHLEDRGIATRMIFSGNVTRQPMLRGVPFRADPKGLPNADRIMESGVMLPCHPTMTDDDCAYLYEAIREFVSRTSA